MYFYIATDKVVIWMSEMVNFVFSVNYKWRMQ